MISPEIYTGLSSTKKDMFVTGSNEGRAEEILKIVCDQLEFSREEITGTSRKKEVTEARHIAIYLIRSHNTRITQAEIGRMFNHDHSTIIHSLRSVGDHMDVDKYFRYKIKKIECLL